MSDYYHQFLSSMVGAGQRPDTNSPLAPQQLQESAILTLGSHAPSNPYHNLGYFTGIPEPIVFNSPRPQRIRRKSAPGVDHIKHRRTRSGCYTCRSRRVKCDETHPVCERCRKGKRDCVYPNPTAPKGSIGQGSKDTLSHSPQTSPTSSNEEEEEEVDRDTKLEPIVDEQEEPDERPPSPTVRNLSAIGRSSTASSSHLHRIATGARQGSETPSLEGNLSSSPSVSAGTASSFTPATVQFFDFPSPAAGVRADWSFLPHEIQFYLGYFCANITNFHYCVANDPDNFFGSILPSIAIHDDALLYAVVGFSAYHHTLQNPNGQIHEFLQYYNKSVTLLLNFLKKRERHTVGTVLTILQLATIEEYLGDWMSLMGHQRAAFEVLLQMFTPQSVMKTPTGRMIFTWYARFDVFVSTLAGLESTLPREWFSYSIQYYDSQAATNPDNVLWRIEACAARFRLISAELSAFVSKASKRELVGDTFLMEHRRLLDKLRAWRSNWDAALSNPAFMVTDQDVDKTADPNSVVRPCMRGVLFKPPLFAMTILRCEWHSTVVMHESQTPAATGEEEKRRDLAGHAQTICQIFETVCMWPPAPKGSLIILQACLATAALFVPKDPGYHMWIRRKFALLENMGYIFPLTMRLRMAKLFGDQGCVHWWLPNDETYTPVLKRIRLFADDRNSTSKNAHGANLRSTQHVVPRIQQAGTVESAGSDDQSASLDKGKNVAARSR
ncbi:hypothetical protein VTK73DRAFT_7092 [Phialemonium thermophilum]|uniref:Zn(2)-C6 fungal-type domain-containing protein n=1 Tax=Phialemonium thermophilum TaxID=223376 RepID=A0ABR3XTP3_9PEZI